MTDHADFKALEQRSVDELFAVWGLVQRAAKESPDPWVQGFVADIAKRRRWRNWKPTPKQLAMMRRLAAQVFEPDDFEVIEREESRRAQG